MPQEDFERLAESSVKSAGPELPPISVKMVKGDSFDRAAAELERELEAVLRTIQAQAYARRQKEEREFLEIL